jgi:D-alanine-D-alanine ligase
VGEPEDAVVADVRRALEANKHTVSTIAVDHTVTDLLSQVQQSGADLVFNVCETFAEDYRMEVNVAALLELAGIRFTGSGTSGLLLAQDKIITKQLLMFHGVPTPQFASFEGNRLEARQPRSLPLIVKPAKSDASIGLKLVKTWDELAQHVQYIHSEYRDDALAEEFIEGREVYVGVVGETSHPQVLPIVELDFGRAWKKGQPRIADREVKFGPETKGSPRLRIAHRLSAELRQRIERAAVTAYRALKLRDYARIDFRISERSSLPFILEVNPNPYLESKSEVAMGAQEIGWSYNDLIERIVQSASRRCGLLPKDAPAVEAGPGKEAMKADLAHQLEQADKDASKAGPTTPK